MTLAAPVFIGEEIKFGWDAFIDVGLSDRAVLLHLAMHAAGLLVLLFAVLPAVPLVRGTLSLLAGVGLPVTSALLHGAGAWQSTAATMGTILAVAGLMARSSYKASMAGRIIASAGALALVAVPLVPSAEASPPLVTAIRQFGLGPVATALGAGLLATTALGVAALVVVWLPRARTRPAALLPWPLLLVVPLPAMAGAMLAEPGIVVREPGTLYPLLESFALAVLGAYGLATLVGKACERSQST
jgi:hypothetical protein